MEWVTAADILSGAGASSTPSPADTEWAELCAAAVSDGLDARLAGAILADPPSQELVLVARLAGVEAYKRREAVFGVTGYIDLQGAAVRVARDYLDSYAPIIGRYATFGIA